MDIEIERLDKLNQAYNQQKKRMIQLIEIDAKKMTTTLLANNLGLKISYLSRLFRNYDISYGKLRDMYIRVQTIKSMLGVKDESDNGYKDA